MRYYQVPWYRRAWGFVFNLLLSPIGLVAMLVGLVVLLVMNDRAIGRECQKNLALATTAHDTLTVTLHCEEMRSQAATRAAIGFGAGMVAGSRR